MNKFASNLRRLSIKDLNITLNNLFVQKGINRKLIKFNFKETTSDDKILNIIQLQRGRNPTKPLLKMDDIIAQDYSDGADELKIYPTFVIDRVLQARKIRLTPGLTIQQKIMNIEMADNGMLQPPG